LQLNASKKANRQEVKNEYKRFSDPKKANGAGGRGGGAEKADNDAEGGGDGGKVGRIHPSRQID
jgi:hypothetical protein